MGSTTITCAEGCTFDAPPELTDAALRLHNRTFHDPPEHQACDHDWRGEAYFADLTCRKCGKFKYVFRLDDSDRRWFT